MINFPGVNDDGQTPTDRFLSFMSIRLYIGNLPQTFEEQELVALLKSVGEGIRFKSVLDRETGACRGFGFANVDDPKLAQNNLMAALGRVRLGIPLDDGRVPEIQLAGELLAVGGDKLAVVVRDPLLGRGLAVDLR